LGDGAVRHLAERAARGGKMKTETMRWLWGGGLAVWLVGALAVLPGGSAVGYLIISGATILLLLTGAWLFYKPGTK
jgi:hypothetical protein